MPYNEDLSGVNMNQLTVRGIDDDLKSCILRLAEREGISMNRAALKLLRKGARVENLARPIDWGNVKKWNGLGHAPEDAETPDSGLQFLAGTWTREEAAEFDAIIEEMFETIDEHMWQ